MNANTLVVGILALVNVAWAQSPPVRISLGIGAAQADGNSSYATISPNGRYVAFSSDATNLVSGDANALNDVFVRDLATGTNQRIDVSTAGVEADWNTYQCCVASTGIAVFASYASNLVPGDLLSQVDVFVRDPAAGTTTRISVGWNGNEANDYSYDPRVSADGMTVVFRSSARNLVPGDTNFATDIFRHDRATGVTSRVSVSASGAQADGISAEPQLSPDGRWLVFTSGATNLVAGDVNSQPDVFLVDLHSGVVELVSRAFNGAQATETCGGPAVSADGRFVAFTSAAPGLVPGDTNNAPDVFVRDRLLATTVRVSVGNAGQQADGGSSNAALTFDGRRIAFVSLATNLVANDTNGPGLNVFLRDLVALTTTCVDRDLDGGTSHTTSPGVLADSMTSDGRSLVFHSRSGLLVPGDTNAMQDVFLVELAPFAGNSLCFGDGTGTPCPCGNSGAPGRGCENSFATGGGLLEARGQASVTQDSIELVASHLPPTSSALFFQGTLAVNGGSGVAFVDGLRCAGGSVIRLGSRLAQSGVAVLGHGVPGSPPIALTGAIPPLGGVRHYQVWYRNAVQFCTPSTSNLTQSVEITWQP